MVKLKDYIKWLQKLAKERGGNLDVFFSSDDEGNSFRPPLCEFSLGDTEDGELGLEPHEDDVDPDDPPFEATAIVLY